MARAPLPRLRIGWLSLLGFLLLAACRAPGSRLGAGAKPGWGRVGGLEPERRETRVVPGAAVPSLPATGLRTCPGWGRAVR